MKLRTLKSLKHDRLKELVSKALKMQPLGSCHQSTIITKICSVAEVTTLRGRPRTEFEGRVNKAISALLRENPPKLVRPNSKSDFIRLTKPPKLWTSA